MNDKNVLKGAYEGIKFGPGKQREFSAAPTQRALYVQCTYIVRTAGTMYVQCTYIVRTVPAGKSTPNSAARSLKQAPHARSGSSF